METNKEKMSANHSEACNCNCGCCANSMWHNGSNHRGIFVLRMLLGIIILLLVFWVGLQVGEFKAYVENNYGGPSRTMMYKTFPGSGNMEWGTTSSQAFPAGQTPVDQVSPTTKK